MPTLINLTGFQEGLTADETGLNVQSVSIKASQDVIEVLNRVGEVRGLVYRNPKMEITITGHIISGVVGGMSTTEIGDVLTSANVAAAGDVGGASGGTILTQSVQVEYKNTELSMFTVNATAWKTLVV